MKHSIILILILATFTNLNSEEILKKEVIDQGHSYYGTLKYIDTYFNGDIMLRQELYFTEAYTQDKGRISQIAFFDKFKNITKYDSEFTQKYESIWGINRVIEIMEGNKAKEIIYRFYNNNYYSYKGADLNTIGNFKIKYITPLIKENKNITKTKNLKLVPGEKFATLVSIKGNNVSKPTAEEFNFIQDWIDGINMKKDAEDFIHIIEVVENGESIRVFVYNDYYEKLMKNKEAILYIIYIGLHDGREVPLVVGFNDYRVLIDE